MATIKDYKRMCKYYKELIVGCFRCPLPCDCDPEDFPDNIDEIVDKWVSEHPPKTYAQDFFEKFPTALRDSDGLPKVCWEYVYGDGKYCDSAACTECWNRQMKDYAIEQAKEKRRLRFPLWRR